MNTIGSVYYGWAFFIACGAGSYYYAKRSINADREFKQRAEFERMARRNRELEAYERQKVLKGGVGALGEDGGLSKGGREEGTEYEAQRPYRSRKGDRFS